MLNLSIRSSCRAQRAILPSNATSSLALGQLRQHAGNVSRPLSTTTAHHPSPGPSPTTTSNTGTVVEGISADGRPSSVIAPRPRNAIGTSTSAATSTTSPSSSSSSAATNTLDWNTFFRLRKVRRRYNLAASILTSMGTTTTGIAVLSRQDIDGISGQLFGLDPIVMLGLATIGCGAAGWLAGPFAGNAVFNMVNKKYKDQMALKEKGFYARIKRFRVIPSSQSVANPVPDYYGEKIGSVAGYRQWLKDQRAYNKKKQNFL